MTVKEARKRLGKTQEEMAALLSISRNYLALIESGKRAEPPDILQRAVTILEQSAGELSAAEWKARALTAESKLERMKSTLAMLLEEY